MESTQPPATEHSSAPLIGTPAEQTTEHQPPAPSPAQHVQAFRETRPGDCVSDH